MEPLCAAAICYFLEVVCPHSQASLWNLLPRSTKPLLPKYLPLRTKDAYKPPTTVLLFSSATAHPFSPRLPLAPLVAPPVFFMTNPSSCTCYARVPFRGTRVPRFCLLQPCFQPNPRHIRTVLLVNQNRCLYSMVFPPILQVPSSQGHSQRGALAHIFCTLPRCPRRCCKRRLLCTSTHYTLWQHLQYIPLFASKFLLPLPPNIQSKSPLIFSPIATFIFGDAPLFFFRIMSSIFGRSSPVLSKYSRSPKNMYKISPYFWK